MHSFPLKFRPAHLWRQCLVDWMEHVDDVLAKTSVDPNDLGRLELAAPDRADCTTTPTRTCAMPLLLGRRLHGQVYVAYSTDASCH